MHKYLKNLLLVAAITPAIYAQQPQFDAATLKLSSPVPLGAPLSINLGSFRNETAMLTNATLIECLQFAYDIVADAQIAGPDWIRLRDVRFDIVGKTGPDVSRDQALLMMQNLLAERLKLSLHHEPREMPFLALVVAKNGPKFAHAKTDAEIEPQMPGRLVHPQISMVTLATLLSRLERQTVIDMTGLTGRFSVDLQWTPDAIGGAVPLANGKPVNIDGPSLPTALQEQLGLRLESRKGLCSANTPSASQILLFQRFN